MKIERTRIHFSATFSLPSSSTDLKVPNYQMPDVTHKIIENTLKNTHTITPIQVNREFFCNSKKHPENANPYCSVLSEKMP